MKLVKGDLELVLEIGFAAVGLGILGGLVLVVLARLSGDAQRTARHAKDPPSAGNVPAERHQNLSSSPR